MNIGKSKGPAAAPFAPIKSYWMVPQHRKVRGKRYDAKGNFLHETGPSRLVDQRASENLKRALEEVKNTPMPIEVVRDPGTYHPLPGRLLLKRPPVITEHKGIEIPYAQKVPPPWWRVVALGAGVEGIAVGDLVIVRHTDPPKRAQFGPGLEGRFHIAPAKHVLALVVE